MKLWGVVSEVNKKDLVISLPGGLRGLVHPEDSCDIFSDYKYKVLFDLCTKFFIYFLEIRLCSIVFSAL